MDKLFQYLTNLFVMAQFVIADERNGRQSTNVAKKRMPEDEIPETICTVISAELFQGSSCAVKVFDGKIPGWGIERIHAFGSLYSKEPNGNDRRGY